MFCLYVKTHNVTGLKYLGQTKRNPFKYDGSGKYWKSHLNKHGKNVSTTILLSTESKEELSETGLFFSNLWNIVESDEWANLKPEEGDGGWSGHPGPWLGRTQSPESNAKRSATQQGVKKSKAHKAAIGKALKGRVFSESHRRKLSEAAGNGRWAGERNGMFGNPVNRGKKHFNNGIVSIMAKECPPGFSPGRLKNIKQLLPSPEPDQVR